MTLEQCKQQLLVSPTLLSIGVKESYTPTDVNELHMHYQAELAQLRAVAYHLLDIIEE